MLKIYIGHAPNCVTKCFKFNTSHHSHGTRTRYHLKPPKGKHEFIFKTFQFQSVYIWNFLLDNIDIKSSFNKFKKDLIILLKTKEIDTRYSR